MNGVSVILCSNNISIISTCIQAGNETGVKLITANDFNTFLFEIQKREYCAAIVECNVNDEEFLHRIKLINKSRPKLPVIIIVEQEERNIGAKILDENIFYLLLSPIDDTLLCEIISAAIKRNLRV